MKKEAKSRLCLLEVVMSTSPAHEILHLWQGVNSEGSDEHAPLCSLARAFTALIHSV